MLHSCIMKFAPQNVIQSQMKPKNFGECLFRVLLVLYVSKTLCDMHITNDVRNIVKSACRKTLSQTLTSED